MILDENKIDKFCESGLTAQGFFEYLFTEGKGNAPSRAIIQNSKLG